MNQAQARQQRAERVAKRRLDEARCAWDFLVNGDLRGRHEEFCIFVVDAAGHRIPGGVSCSRVYDPGPMPDDERLYEGAALGTLWGLNAIGAWQLAGWDVKPRRRTT